MNETERYHQSIHEKTEGRIVALETEIKRQGDVISALLEAMDKIVPVIDTHSNTLKMHHAGIKLVLKQQGALKTATLEDLRMLLRRIEALERR